MPVRLGVCTSISCPLLIVSPALPVRHESRAYEALAQINRAFEQVFEGLKRLQDNGVVAVECVQDQSIMAGELCAGINAVMWLSLRITGAIFLDKP
jgi:hypothetical protein